jgi:hypothetical protein
LGKLRLLGDNIAKAPVPVPDKVTFCVPRLSVRTTDAALLPIVTGANVTFTTQLVPAGRFAPQVLVCEKSLALAPPSATDVMGRGAVPVFCTVMACDALEVPIGWFGKARERVDRVTAGARPVPLNAMLWTPSPSEIVTVAVRVPAAVGANVMLIVQLDPAVRLVPHEFVSENSPALAPISVTDAIGSGAFPVFDNVTAAGTLVEPTS